MRPKFHDDEVDTVRAMSDEELAEAVERVEREISEAGPLVDQRPLHRLADDLCAESQRRLAWRVL